MTTIKINNNRTTEISKNGSVHAIKATVYRESENLVALEILIDNEECMIIAYGDKKIPSVILADTLESGKFTHFSFVEFEKFEVWSADLSGDTLRVCLVK